MSSGALHLVYSACQCLYVVAEVRNSSGQHVFDVHCYVAEIAGARLL